METGPRFLVEDPRFVRACRVAALAAVAGGLVFAVVAPRLFHPG